MNIEEHRQPWESDEHWVFRQQFMVTHQGKFSDDRLLCLAQVFANIELLGCSYPAPVMQEVSELAKAISSLDSIRKKRMDKAAIKFVKASSEGSGNNAGKKRSGDSYPSGSQSKFSRGDNRQYGPGQYNNNRPGAASFFRSQDDRPHSFSGMSENTKTAKLEAAKDAWTNLQKRFYTVQIKELICEEGEQVSKSNLTSGGRSSDRPSEGGAEGKTLTEDNIGFKMLRMMGWGGGGVGKQGNEGIVQPVSVKDVYKREGLGFTREGRDADFRKGVNDVIKNFVVSGTCCDLAFSPEFTKEERMYIHRIAERFKLRNASHGGKGANRHVVLSRRFRPQQLLEHLMNSGGSTKKYDLIPPTGC